MRIICDHCGNPIAGRVQRIPGNLNFHPDCLAEAVEGTRQEANGASWENQQRSASGHVDTDSRQY
ncbi:MAG TPA: hypothetical protein VJ124_24920 [Pyrinomonadaceae bacterium]|nr:hypothetical protein [Pyrinomonadaceae bacterium]